METAVTQQDDGGFRTRVKVKGATQTAAAPEIAPIVRPRSLIEALKQGAMAPDTSTVIASAEQPSSAKPPAKKRKKASAKQPRKTAGKASAEPTRAAEAPARPVDTTPPLQMDSPRDTLAAQWTPGRRVAARLKQIEHLKETTAGLEFLARGEIEEATVEIIRHDGKPLRTAATGGDR